MSSRQTAKKANHTSSFAGTAASLVVLALVFGFFASSPAAGAECGRNTMEEEIWKLEEAYFTNLYRTDYEGVLALVHPQFLGWPGNLPKPIGREESAQFMKKLILGPRRAPSGLNVPVCSGREMRH